MFLVVRGVNFPPFLFLPRLFFLYIYSFFFLYFFPPLQCSHFSFSRLYSYTGIFSPLHFLFSFPLVIYFLIFTTPYFSFAIKVFTIPFFQLCFQSFFFHLSFFLAHSVSLFWVRLLGSLLSFRCLFFLLKVLLFCSLPFLISYLRIFTLYYQVD